MQRSCYIHLEKTQLKNTGVIKLKTLYCLQAAFKLDFNVLQ